MPLTRSTTPRRILILSSDPTSGVLPFLTALTGSAPTPHPQAPPTQSPQGSPVAPLLPNQPDPQNQPAPPIHPNLIEDTNPTQTTAGLSHTLHLSNTYYTADIPIWIDETSDPDAWARDFETEDARDVVRAVGAWVVVFRLPVSWARLNNGSGTGNGDGDGDGDLEDSRGNGGRKMAMLEAEGLLKAVHSAIRAAYDGNEDEWDGVCLAVGWPKERSSGVIVSRESGPQNLNSENVTDEDAEREEWEDLCFDYGFEFVDCCVQGGRNKMGELKGLERVKEALEANEWEGGALVEDGEEEFDVDGGSEDGFGMFSDGEMMNKELLKEDEKIERDLEALEIGTNYGFDTDADDTNEHGEAHQVEDLERLMGSMMAIKEMTAHMPREQRKKAAARAVHDIMKTM